MELGVFPVSCHFKSCEDNFTKVFIGGYSNPLSQCWGT